MTTRAKLHDRFVEFDPSGQPRELDIIDTENIADSAIETAKINDLAVTTAKIADSAITADKIADGAIEAKEMALAIRAGEALGVGDLVYVSSWNETVSRPVATKADADAAGKLATYVAKAVIGNGANGTVWKQARLTGVNTGGSAVGDPVYLSATAGGWTLVKPTAVNAIVQVVGRVAVVHAVTGEVEINLITGNEEAIGRNELQADVIDGTKLADDAVNTEHIADSAVKPVHLSLNARAAEAIAIGDLVYISSWSEAELRPTINKADNNAAGKLATYVADAVININTNGVVQKRSRLTGVNTDGSVVGDPVYLNSVAGGWTVTKPTGVNEIVQIVGRIAVVDIAVGEIEFNLLIENVEKIGRNELQNDSVDSTKLVDGAVVPDKLSLDVRAGEALAAGDIVYVSSWNEAQVRPEVTKADANAAGKMATYVARAVINNGDNGVVWKQHRLTGVNTDGKVVGDPVYLDTTPGGWTLTKPTAANSIVQIIGRVAVVDIAVGQIEINLLIENVEKVGTNELQDDAITTAKIVNDAVTTDKILNDAVTTAKILNANVTAAKLAPGVVVATTGVVYQNLGAPSLSVTNDVHAAIVMPDAVPLEVVAGITNPDIPRVVTATGNQATVAGNLVIDGTAIDDSVIQDTIVLAGVATVVGIKAFKTVTKITVPIKGAGGDTVEVGRGDKLGLNRTLAATNLLFTSFVDKLSRAPDLVTVDAADVEKNVVDVATVVYNGAKYIAVLMGV